VAQFGLWTGQNPPVEVMRQALVESLANRSA
jgi:shikimate 5-dehydrogenase